MRIGLLVFPLKNSMLFCVSSKKEKKILRCFWPAND